jgi:hypothetical protein
MKERTGKVSSGKERTRKERRGHQTKKRTGKVSSGKERTIKERKG